MTEQVIAKKKKPAKKERGPEIAPGVELPSGVDRYRVMRCDPVHPFQARRPLAIPKGGMRVDAFEVADGLPDVRTIKTIWGSGAYRFAWFRGTTAAGMSPHIVLDDPAFPQRPDYTPASPEAAAVASAPPPNPLLEVLKTQADGSGKVDLATALVFLQAMAAAERSQRAEAEAQHRRWREEDEARARRREEDHQRELERERARAESERQTLETFWERQNEQAAEMRRAARGEDVDEELSDLGQAVNSLAEAQKTSARQTQDMWSKVLDTVAPAIPGLLAKFTGQPATR